MTGTDHALVSPGGMRLLAAGADANRGLPAAVWSGETGIVATLLEAGADPNAPLTRSDYKDRLSLTPLHAAALLGHAEIAGLLVEAGADIRADARYKNPGLFDVFAAIWISSLLFTDTDDVLNTDLEDMHGWSPLQFAAAGRHRRIVRYLTEASLSERGNTGDPP